MTPSTIIFDLDGTLLNTLDDLHASVSHALSHLGLPPIDRLSTRRYLGNGVQQLVYSCVAHVSPTADEATKAEALHIFRQHYIQHSMDTTAPYPGVMDMLHQCKQAGITTAIVSNKLDEAVKDLHRRFFADSIDLATGETPDVKRKPAPDMVLKAIDLLSAKTKQPTRKADCLYVGDSEVDLQTAAAAELPCVAVSWGFRDREWIEQCGATCIIDHPSELLSVLPSLAAKP